MELPWNTSNQLVFGWKDDKKTLCYAFSIGLYLITLFRIRNAFRSISIDQFNISKRKLYLQMIFVSVCWFTKYVHCNMIEKIALKTKFCSLAEYLQVIYGIFGFDLLRILQENSVKNLSVDIFKLSEVLNYRGFRSAS